MGRPSYVAILGLALCATVLVTTITYYDDVVDIEEISTVEVDMDSDDLRFLLVGDTGGLPIYPYTTFAQKKVAKSMAKIAQQKSVECVLNMGDNIYFTGVSDEYDDRFRSSFEEVYNYDSLDVPWYMIGGNHDHFGNITAQVAYSKHSKKWRYPNLYYDVSFKSKSNVTIDIIFIDTIVLCGNTADIENGGFVDVILNSSHEPSGPKSIPIAEKHWEWVESKLNVSSADYLIVAGHFPMYSMSSHGPTKCLVDRLDPMLTKYNVSAYFTGHDHTLQHIVMPGANGHEIHHVVSGAASRSDRSTKHKKDIQSDRLKYHYPNGWNPFSQLGFSNGAFIFMSVNNERALLDFYDGKGNRKYDANFYPRGRIPREKKLMEVILDR